MTLRFKVLALLFAIVLLGRAVSAQWLGDDDDDAEISDYLSDLYESDNDALQSLVKRTSRRMCLGHGRRCSLRRNDCCSRYICKCNLWGQNCKCEPRGFSFIG
ncbi:PREDICTED: U8-agatoxin-Ao1a-like [Priapulus caudatus]|uniref:U8-agatoxin-Ao1a-like n=1 Tax=Priapulus caudatus TaxID=37621 RepID=A0ABM1DY25_PRICU|nr:PREDICTED: U8-agatoxin-Ao1a-like [Priapulus caudatus]XP_014664847.1 PREDICTED: U8-agatoxin-Ao1a-like [Priapulus caudatus]